MCGNKIECVGVGDLAGKIGEIVGFPPDIAVVFVGGAHLTLRSETMIFYVLVVVRFAVG